MTRTAGEPGECSNWVDTGCEYHPACLTCPEEMCRYDTPHGIQNDVAPRDNEIRRLRAEGIPIPALMEAYQVSRSTVNRVCRNGVDNS
jgi:hypothetical protein